jgi:DNA (cytosine-5)-methyltransferase 1
VRPRLLDLFCGAGGGFNGLPPRRVCFPLEGFDAIHASPPCQLFTAILALALKTQRTAIVRLNLIPPTRARLVDLALPWVIENVPGAPLIRPVRLCGTSFGLPLRRHRLFESNSMLLVPPCAHKALPRAIEISVGDPRRHGEKRDRHSGWSRYVGVYGSTHRKGEDRARRAAMEIDWMSRKELTQAIPPAYTELIGLQLMNALRLAA